MGQKVNPVSFRLGVNKGWLSRWFNVKEMPRYIVEDEKIRKFIRKRSSGAGVSKVFIERMGENIRVTIHTDKPGVIIGKGGSEAEKIKDEIDDMTGMQTTVNIEQVKNPNADAHLVAQSIATALEKKIRFRNVMRRAVARAMESGAKGVKVAVSGRLNGAEIARTEWMKEGRIPLQTIRAEMDYGFVEAKTTYGNIGVKVWVFNGENLESSGS
ncbi:MAG: 30S ribosomal protein S3 [Elusimicrobiota bacterium]